MSLEEKGVSRLLAKAVAEMTFKPRSPVFLPDPATPCLCISERAHHVSFALPSAGRGKKSICHWDRRVWGCHSNQPGDGVLKGPKVPVFMDAFSGYVKCPFPPQPTVFKANISADLRLLAWLRKTASPCSVLCSLDHGHC